LLTAKQQEVAETVFDRNKRREAEINEALKQESARHEGSGQEHAAVASVAAGARARLNKN
jgi:hypothetical protein